MSRRIRSTLTNALLVFWATKELLLQEPLAHQRLCCPVRELLLDRRTPQLSDQERDEVPPVQRQSKIMFISDIDVELFVGQEEFEQEPHENTVFVLDRN